ncbi:hypothetical protein FRC09_012394, partial [Ceratobasidium sp. 395]
MATTPQPLEKFLDVDLKPKSSALPHLEADEEGQYATKVHYHKSTDDDIRHLNFWIYHQEATGLFEIRQVQRQECEDIADYFVDNGRKLRYNWYSDTRTAVFKLPKPAHEAVGEWLLLQVPWINQELVLASRCGVPRLDSNGSATVELPNGGSRQPDKGLVLGLKFENPPGTFRGLNNPIPRVILETTDSQCSNSAMRTIADQLSRSNGQTHLAILCMLSYPVTNQPDFCATIETWVRYVPEGDIDQAFPHEHRGWPHDVRPIDQPMKHGGVENTPAAAEDQGSVESNELTTAGTEADTTPLKLLTYKIGDSEFTICRRWGPVVLINEDPENGKSPGPACGPDAVLPLRVFDFLRVCRLHDEPEFWPKNNELELPLNSLRSRLESVLAMMRVQYEEVPPSPPGPENRLNPALSRSGIKRRRPV